MNKINLIVIGGFGRLGKAVLEAVDKHENIQLKAIVVRKNSMKERRRHNAKLTTDLSKVVAKGDIVFDASNAKSVKKHIQVCLKAQAAYVLSVTGVDPKTRQVVEKAAHSIPVVITPNLSVGVAVLKEITYFVASLLPDADVEIIESHHRNKLDAPSGTALMLASSILEASEKKADLVLGRAQSGLRQPNSIGIHSVRGGDVVGEHRLQFLLDGEKVELIHSASNRNIFAKGAVRTVQYIAEAQPGLYTMRDVLGLSQIH